MPLHHRHPRVSAFGEVRCRVQLAQDGPYVTARDQPRLTPSELKTLYGQCHGPWHAGAGAFPDYREIAANPGDLDLYESAGGDAATRSAGREGNISTGAAKHGYPSSEVERVSE